MVSKHGYSTIAAVSIFAAVVCTGAYFLDHWISYLLYASMGLLVGLIVFFFRDPDRDIPDDPDLLVAPADGKIVFLGEVDEDVYIKGKAVQISIFLSPLDVHVNRTPAAGTIEYLKYHPGVYLMAWDHRASDMNERADFGLRHPSGARILFRQITGFMARRIVYHLKEGDTVRAGERFGMMKFGSRMDILVPPGIGVEVQKGQRTVAGETVLGRISGT